MITTRVPKTQHNYWQELTSKVQEIGQRTKTSHSTHLPNQKNFRKRKITRFEVEEAWHRQKEKTLIINNRLKYLKVQREKQNRTLQLARKKYEYLMEARASSTREKNNFRKIVKLNQLQTERVITQNVSRVRGERVKTSLSVSQVKQFNEQQGKQLRHKHFENESYIRQSRTLDVKAKREIVNRIQEANERSKLRLKQIYKERILAGKSRHTDYLQNHIELNLKQRKKNSFLKLKLEESLITTEHNVRINLIKYNSLLTPMLNQGVQASSLKQT